MLADSKLRFETKVIASYTSPDGPDVVAVRAALYRERLEGLRQAGHYERYVQNLAPHHREVVLNSLPASWIPIDSVMAHYRALDALELSDAQLTRLSVGLGANLYQTMFSALLRLIRSNGPESGPWEGFKQADRVFSRLYRGGSVNVAQVGPKDAVHEQGGIPFADSRSFRIGHSEFIRGVVNLNARSCAVKEVRSRVPRTERFALSVSWV